MSKPKTDRCDFLKAVGTGVFALSVLAATGSSAFAAQTAVVPDMSNGADNFYSSAQVTVEKVRFRTQYQMNVAGNLYMPKNFSRASAHPAIIVGHPMGAVKEQSANLYATKMAEQGFVTLSIDLPFWGESDGEPRNLVAPDIYAEAFSAAVDFLGTQAFVDRERIGVIGICGSGSTNTRLLATARRTSHSRRSRKPAVQQPPRTFQSTPAGCVRLLSGSIHANRPTS